MNTLTFKLRKWWKQEWDLCWNERIIGTLLIKSKLSGPFAKILINDELKWQIGRKGWLMNRILLLDARGNTISEGIPSTKWGSKEKIVLGGKEFTLSSNWLQSRFTARDSDGQDVVSIKANWWKSTAEITTLNSPEDETTKLLICILFYRLKLAEWSSAAVVVV